MTPAMRARQSATVVVVSSLVLALIGILAIYSVTAVSAIRDGHIFSSAFVGQCQRLLVAALACAIVARMDYRVLADRSRWWIIAVWVGLIAVLLFGVDVKGARRWIRPFGLLNLQISEFAKLAVVFACAQFVHRRREFMGSYFGGFLPGVAWLGVTVLLVAVEPDFGTSMFLICLGLLLFFLGGMKLKHITATGLLVLPIFILFMVTTFSHILPRLKSLSTGEPHAQVQRSLNAMGSGGLFGQGLGGGRAHLDLVWEVETDFIFASIAEQCGLIGSLTVLALFGLLFWHGFRIARLASDDRGYLIAFGITFMVAFQAGINVSVVTGLVPPKGISLPFISFGGSSLLTLGVAIGLLVSVARRVGEESDERTLSPESPEVLATDEPDIEGVGLDEYGGALIRNGDDLAEPSS